MSFPDNMEFFIDPSRCIGCQACVHACAECDSHKGTSMIHLEYIDRDTGVQTAPVVCMHCEDPACANVCPADAIKKDEHGRVLSAAKPRCVSCNNCVLSCPFGVPKMEVDFELMMKCDMCYDRTSEGKKPMCATVCPSQALHFGPRDKLEAMRQEKPVNQFQFGLQTVKTKVNMMTSSANKNIDIDILSFLPSQGSTPISEKRVGAPDMSDLSVWDLKEFKGYK